MEYNLKDDKFHYGLLYKINELKGQVLSGRKEIKGIDGKGIEADDIVPEKHFLHDLIRGIYKPKGKPWMLSYLATEKDSNYGKQIIWKDSKKDSFEKIILVPPNGEKDNRKISDIKAAEFVMEHKIPIGIFVNIGKIKKCLGLGIIKERSEEGNFIVYPVDMEFDLLKEENTYYTFKTNNEEIVEKFLNQEIIEFEFGGLQNFYEEMKEGDIVFFVLGGDKPKWDLGLRGICKISRSSYDKGYRSDKTKQFKVNLKKELILNRSINREQMIPYRNTYNMTFIGPSLKGEPNQANVKPNRKEVISVVRALLDYFPEYEEKLIDIFGTQVVSEAKEVDEILEIRSNNTSKVSKIFNIENNKKDILKYIDDFIKSKSFIYEINDLSNFYLSLKVKPFVILAGISGTGKSKLVKLFAESIGATSENGQYNLISVKPDWNDSTELLGYKNIKDEFVAGKLLKVIEEASKAENRNKPYFVCLDEMNLARVEYYLSEYLSILESREFKGEEIITHKIFPEEYLDQDNKYKGLIIPDNLYIIGTVNMDDTTFAFSRKVLDRANTIEFSKVDLELLDFLKEPIKNTILENEFLKTRFLNIKEAVNIDENYVNEVNKKIVDINNILKPYSKHFGYRVRDEIIFYMLENKLSHLLDENTAFDYQIMQKILPSIIGSEESIKDILIKLYEYCVYDVKLDPNGDYVEEAFENLHKAKYKLSANKIIMMLRGYRDGYTSFWI